MNKTITASICRKQWLNSSVLGRGAMIFATSLAGAAHASDLPTGGSVAAGAASIASGLDSVAITQTSSRAVLNWNSFDVGAGKSVSFNQPDAASATLNRVTGATTSTIAGNISSNGAVYLINPNGISITSTGSVNTAGGFVASTLDMVDADFMAGNIKFNGSGASGHVSNGGSITAGQGAYVALLGGSVSNAGFINVPLGRVGLGSGESIALDLNGGGFMQVAVPTNALTGETALIDLSGSISASGGTVLLKAASVKNAVRNIINMSGSINADSVSGNGGTITLLGGADTAHMGGTVTVNGTLSARATGASGDGGFVETSGAEINFVGVRVDTTSVGGQTGTWLVDPTNLTVDAATANTIGTNLATANVTLMTTATTASGLGIQSAGLGDISINASINAGGPNLLTLSAYHDVIFAAGAVYQSPAGLTIIADNTGTGSGTLTFGSGARSNAIQTNIYYNPTSYVTPTNFSSFSSFGVRAFMWVKNLTDLQNINTNLSGNYALATNIDATATQTGAGFVPLGTLATPFVGLFDGLSRTITKLSSNRTTTDYVGMFGVLGTAAQVTNLKLVLASFQGQDNVGAIAGLNRGSITNVSATDNFVRGRTLVGGLVGRNENYIYGTYVTGSVTGSANLGGLVGQNTSSGQIRVSYTTDNVTGLDGANFGGLVALNSGIVENTYATGSVSGFDSSGGLIGNNQAGATINNSYAIGSVGGYGGVNQGGLVGANTGAVTNSYWNTQTSGRATSAGGTGFTTAQMQDFFTFGARPPFTPYSGWDFLTIWSPPTQIGQGAQVAAYYPQLYALTPVVVVQPNAATKVYGTLNPALTGAVVGGASNNGTGVNPIYFSGTQGNLLPSTGLFSTSANVASGVGQYGIVGTSNGNIVSSDGTVFRAIIAGTNKLTITPAPLTVTYTATPFVRNYGAANGLLTGTTSSVGLVNGDALIGAATFSTLATSASNIGTYAITGAGLSASANYATTFIQAPVNATALTINPAPLQVTYTANPATRRYGAANPVLSGTTQITGFVNGDAQDTIVTGSAVFSTPNSANLSGIGQYQITGIGISSNTTNYTVVPVQGPGNLTALTITAAPLSVTASALSRNYGAANPALTYSATGLVAGGDTLTGSLATAATSTSVIGGYAITQGTLAASPNYTLSYTGATLTVNKAPLTITAAALSRLYGDPNPALTFSATGLVNGDIITGALATSALNTSSVGAYAIMQGTLAASTNYALTYVGANLSVTPAPLTVTYNPNPSVRPYGSSTAGLTGSVTSVGLKNGDTLLTTTSGVDTILGVTTGTPTWTTVATSASPVDSYIITGGGLTANSSNYSFTFVQAPNTGFNLYFIVPASLRVTANAASRLYGAANPALSYSSVGLVNGDSFTGALATTATTASNIGNYAITQGTLSAGSNYVISYTGANLVINPAPLTVTATATTRFYGAANPVFAYSTTGLVNGDTLTGVLSSTATTTSGIGQYSITQGTLAASINYTMSYVGATLTVTPALLTVTYTASATSRTYGSTNPTLTGTTSANGLAGGDTLAGVTSGAAAFTTTATISSNVGKYAVNGAGLIGTSENYRYSFVQNAGNTTALTVNPATLTVTYVASAASRVYGTGNPSLTGTQTVNGLLNGDTQAAVVSGTATYSTTAAATTNVGSYAVTGSGLSATSNYVIAAQQAPANAAALTITQRGLTITASAATRLFGLANPIFAYVASPADAASGLVNGDTLSGALTSAANLSSPAGSYAITQGSLAASTNYKLTYVGANLTVNAAPTQLLNSFLPDSTNLPVQNVFAPPTPLQPCIPTLTSQFFRVNGQLMITNAQGGGTCVR